MQFSLLALLARFQKTAPNKMNAAAAALASSAAVEFSSNTLHL